MRIAISAQGEELDSMVDPRFGRATCFIIYDTENETHVALDNKQNAGASQGAGVQAAQKVIAQKPDLIISGNFGPKAFQVLSAAGIKTALWSDGKVSEVIELAKNNQLEIAKNSNVTGHWK